MKYIKDLSKYLNPVNHMIYEIIIIISIFTFIKKFEIENDNENYVTSLKHAKSFIILVCIFAVLLDWLIWFDFTGTIIFACILCIYVYYNFTNMNNIAKFMNMLDVTSSNYSDILINPDDAALKAKEDEEIRKLTLIPSEIRNNTSQPVPFDKQEISINDYNDAYNFDRKTYKTLTDNEYAQTMLNKLHDSPYYKSLQPQQLDVFKPQDINYSFKEISIQKSNNNDDDQVLLNSFQNPQRIFLDKTWLEKNNRYYNDNCVSCKGTSSGNSPCNIVEYGKKLEKCTNDHGNVTEKQLESISNNQLEPIYKGF